MDVDDAVVTIHRTLEKCLRMPSLYLAASSQHWAMWMRLRQMPLTSAELIAFETKIADAFNAAKIRAPVHLQDGPGYAEKMIEVFKEVGPNDWICTSWRSHWQCLLRGVPPDELERDIMAGRSISLCYPKYRIVSSAMVGGILPIALGIAFAIKRAGGSERVHAWSGDMTALTGIFHECWNYAKGHNLPIRFIVEDNGKSVCTDTRAVWGDTHMGAVQYERFTYYESRYPHAGAGQRVQF